jgi:hypothetical protein
VENNRLWEKEPTGVNPAVQIQERLLGGLEASFDNGLFTLDLAFSQPLCKLLARGTELRGVVEDDEALESDAHRDDHYEILSGINRIIKVGL